MRLLDLFCKAGGTSMGYHRAGFEVVGVDIEAQPKYPFEFHQADALEFLADHGHEFDAIAASPPCQGYSALKHLSTKKHPKLVIPTRKALKALGKPWVMENVVGAPLRNPLILCGSMFRLGTPCGAELRRHRLFESSIKLVAPGPCCHGWSEGSTISVTASGQSVGKTISLHGGKARDRSIRTVSITGHSAERRGGYLRTITVSGSHPRDSSISRAEYRKTRTITVTGQTAQQNTVRNTTRECFSIQSARIAMGIDWMGMKELSQAIPPAYTEWIGTQLMEYLLGL